MDKAFEIKSKQYIVITDRYAYFSDKANHKSLTLSKAELLECLQFVIDNAYVVHNGIIYKQVVGIPMGNNMGPHLANIYLHVYESDFIGSISEADTESYDRALSQKLKDIFRFQDDLLAFNDDGWFGNIMNDMYPVEMIVNNTNLSVKTCSYLDLFITIQHGKFIFKLFDKRKQFNFNVISYPFICGNVPRMPTYGIYISQLIRFCLVNCKFENFKQDVTDLTQKLINQGFKVELLSKKFDKFYYSYIHLWSKFGKELMEYKNTFLNWVG